MQLNVMKLISIVLGVENSALIRYAAGRDP